jgi:hypothetical protein
MSTSGAIPISARTKNDGWFPNPRDLSTTPGGTIYATTPGGTRIVYDREALLKFRESPLAKTPTKVLPVIPGVTAPDDHEFMVPHSPKILVITLPITSHITCICLYSSYQLYLNTPICCNVDSHVESERRTLRV